MLLLYPVNSLLQNIIVKPTCLEYSSTEGVSAIVLVVLSGSFTSQALT